MIATCKSARPVELRNGDPVIVERRGGERIVRSVPRLDSGETIEGTAAFIASVREFAAGARRR